MHELHYKNRPDIYVDGNPLPLDFFKNTLNDNNAINYVYEEDGVICGLLMAIKKNNRSIPIMKSRTIYFIEDIVVDKKHRRKGIGKKLYYFLKEKAKEDNVDAIELNVWALNSEAIKFCESLGMAVNNMEFEQLLSTDKVETKNIDLKITNKVD